MFEWFTKIKSINDFKEAISDTQIRDFLVFYINDQNCTIEPSGLCNMFRYYQVETQKKFVDREIGLYASLMVKKLKQKNRISDQLTVKRQLSSYISLKKKLDTHIRHKEQYVLLSEYLIGCDDETVRWIVRFLCRKITFSEEQLKIIRKEEGE